MPIASLTTSTAKPTSLRFLFASLIIFLVCSFVSSSAFAGVTLRGATHPAYDLQLTVAADLRTVQGRETISFTNSDLVELRDVWVRVWNNESCNRPAVAVQIVRGGQLTGRRSQCTALDVKLDTAILPGQSGEIELTFTARIPQQRYSDRFGIEPKTGTLMAGNLVPVLAVTDQDGLHITEPYSGLGESFYSLSAKWHAMVELPAQVDGAITGTTISESPLEGGGKRVETLSETARDFAFAVGKNYVLDQSVQDGVMIRYFHPPAATQSAKRKWAQAMVAAQESVRIFNQEYGEYGSAELDVANSRGIAMEYPEMVMTPPEPIVIAHEIGHQWWFGIVGNNEFKEPWIDESFAAYSEGDFARYVSREAMERLGLDQPLNPRTYEGGFFISSCNFKNPYAPKVRLTAAGKRLPRSRQRKILRDLSKELVRKDFALNNDMRYFGKYPDMYGAGVYYGGSCALEGLRNDLGAKRMRTLLQQYVAAHRFGVSTTQDFLSHLTSFTRNQRLVKSFTKRSRILVNN